MFGGVASKFACASCVRFLFGEGEGASFFFPLCIEKKSSRVCVTTHETQTRAHLSLESLFQHILILLVAMVVKVGVSRTKGRFFSNAHKHSL